MTYTFTLDKADYLNYQLFFVSTSEHHRKQRLKSRLTWTFTFLFLGFVCYREKVPFLAIYFVILAVVYGIFSNYISKWSSKRNLEAHIETVLKNRFDKPLSVIIDEHKIHEIEENYETKVSLSEIERIYETSDYFYAQLKSGIAIVFPRQKIENGDALEDQLRDIAAKNQISFTEMTDWKW